MHGTKDGGKLTSKLGRKEWKRMETETVVVFSKVPPKMVDRASNGACKVGGVRRWSCKSKEREVVSC